jgi:alanine racemase
MIDLMPCRSESRESGRRWPLSSVCRSQPVAPARYGCGTPLILAGFRHARALAVGTRAVAVVKANGYGHGAAGVAGALAGEADAFAVACLEEATALRDAGIQGPVLLLEGVFERAELTEVDRLGLWMVVHDERQLRWLEDYRPRRPFNVWLKLDTGMHRLGLAPGGFAAALGRLRALSTVDCRVAMTHFACADELDNPATARQLQRLVDLAAPERLALSMANSAAVMAWPGAHGDWIRPGIMLYGMSPLDRPHPGDRGLRPAMTLRSSLIAIHELNAGDRVGYGGRYRCDGPTRIGVVAIGYADGYPRHAPDGTPVAVNGKRTGIAGRVSMDMVTVDLGPVPGAAVGDPVELWGAKVSANEVAEACGTIAYELFARVTARVPVDHVDRQ